MPQVGILFDPQKLGTGFHGYTSFRILFSVLKVADLAGCSFSHGTVEEAGRRIYCIAVSTANRHGLTRIRERLAQTVTRGLMPPECRFLEEYDIEALELAPAAAVSDAGQLARCESRWLQEAWERSQPAMQSAAAVPAIPPPVKVAVRPKAQPVPAGPQATVGAREPAARLPVRVPFPLWWSHHGRRAFALMIAFCFGSAVLPVLGPGVALSAMLAVAGAIQGIAMVLRLAAEHRYSNETTMAEVKKLAVARDWAELCQQLGRPGAQASPLLRVVQSVTRSWAVNRDEVSVTAILEQHRKAEEHILQADVDELRFLGWAAPALAVCSFFAMQVFVGVPESWMEAPKLALAGAVGWLLMEGMRCWVRSAAQRLYGEIARLTLGVWLPVLEASAAAPRGPQPVHIGA